MWSIWMITFIFFWSSIKAGSLPGPRSLDDTIAVIGGGFSAIHMAHLLKERGFTKINILVKGDRLGGDDAYSVTHRGTVHEMGKHMLIPKMMSLELEYLTMTFGEGEYYKDIIEIPASSVWTTKTKNNQNQVVVTTLIDYLTAKANEGTATSWSEEEIRELMVQNITNFESKVKLLLDLTYQIPSASWPKKFKLKGSFKDFLENNDMQMLVPIFTYLFSSVGYGRLEDFSAYYGIMFFRPEFMDALKSRLGKHGFPGFTMMSSGIENFLDSWSSSEGMNVTRHVRIDKIVTRKDDNGKHKIEMYVNGVKKSAYYDFIVYAGCLKEYVALNRLRSRREYQMFLLPKTKYLIKTLVDSVNVARGLTPVNYYADSFQSKGDYQLAYSIDSYATYKGYTGNKYQSNELPNMDAAPPSRAPGPASPTTRAPGTAASQSYMSAVYTQMSENKPTVAEANRRLTDYLKARGGTDIKIIETKVYPFFSKYEEKDLNNGILNEILKEQGKHGVWYVGRSVYIDNIISMIGYNDMLINKSNWAIEE